MNLVNEEAHGDRSLGGIRFSEPHMRRTAADRGQPLLSWIARSPLFVELASKFQIQTDRCYFREMVIFCRGFRRWHRSDYAGRSCPTREFIPCHLGWWLNSISMQMKNEGPRSALPGLTLPTLDLFAHILAEVTRPELNLVERP